MNDKTNAQDEQTSNKALAVDEIRYKLYDNLKNLQALLRAARDSECFEKAGMPESVDDVSYLVRMCIDQVTQALAYWDVCEPIINEAICRERYPELKDPISPRVVTDVVSVLTESEPRLEWYRRVSLVGGALARYARIYSDLEPAVEALIRQGRRMGGDFRLLNGRTKGAEVAFYGPLPDGAE